jgi:hypothetical protein
MRELDVSDSQLHSYVSRSTNVQAILRTEKKVNVSERYYSTTVTSQKYPEVGAMISDGSGFSRSSKSTRSTHCQTSKMNPHNSTGMRIHG